MKNPEHSQEQTLPQEIKNDLEILAKKFERLNTPILTVDILTDSIEKFNMVLDEITRMFPEAEIRHGEKTGIDQYKECAQILQEGSGTKIIIDQNTYSSVPHDGYMHSQDQGLKSGRYRSDYDSLSKQHGSRIIIVRFCNTTQKNQLLAGLATNDFRDMDIKFYQ